MNAEWIDPKDKARFSQWEALLQASGLRPDGLIEATLGLFDEEGRLAAAGSLSGKTLRCIAVDPAYRGEDLLGTLLSELCAAQYARGNSHLFLYTKCESAAYFRSFGFSEIARAEGLAVFMENSQTAFMRYAEGLQRGPGLQGAVVMNANPFTLGHRHLVETARKSCDTLHLFVVSEDVSDFSFTDRFTMVRRGTEDIKGILYHPTEDYLISRGTFPSYFLKRADDAACVQARLDASVFIRIAGVCGIKERYLGEEPESPVTASYNLSLLQELPKQGIACKEIPRICLDGLPISASRVRALLRQGRQSEIAPLVPKSTLQAILSGQCAMRE